MKKQILNWGSQGGFAKTYGQITFKWEGISKYLIMSFYKMRWECAMATNVELN